MSGRSSVTAEGAEAYLETKFGDHLEAARAAMTTLAHAYRPRELAAEAFMLYKEFRPAVPEGVRGRGAKGILDLRKIRSLAKVVAIDGMDDEAIRGVFPREKPRKTRGVRNEE